MGAVDELVHRHALGGEVAVVVAVLAEVRALGAVGLGAVHLLVGDGHAAALAVVAHGHVEEALERHAEGDADELDHVDAGGRLALLPAAHGLSRHVESARHLLLRDARLLSDGGDNVLDGHGVLLARAFR